MRGHIQQRGKHSWRVKVFVGRDGSGVRRYVQRTVRGTRRDAEREFAQVVVEVDEGRHAARFEASDLSAREVARALGTSPAQLYRLLDPTNYTKSVRQLLSLLYVLACDVEVEVTERRRAAS